LISGSVRADLLEDLIASDEATVRNDAERYLMARSTDVVPDTIAEIQRPLDKNQVLPRLRDWRDRIHHLYDDIQNGLGKRYRYDRAAQYRTFEEIVQRAGLAEADIPSIDILRITESDGTLRAIIQPRHLWIIGANGRVDLTIIPKSGIGRRQFMLLDLSRPLRRRSDWRLVSPGERLEQPTFTPGRLRELLE
jgi:hypothetical protein